MDNYQIRPAGMCFNLIILLGEDRLLTRKSTLCNHWIKESRKGYFDARWADTWLYWPAGQSIWRRG